MSEPQTKQQQKKKIIYITAAALLVLVVIAELIFGREAVFDFLGLNDVTKVPEGEISVHFIDVEQGDCILIQAGEDNILIDCGEKSQGENVSAYLDGRDVDKIDYLIATHPHSDHIGAMSFIIDNFDIGELIMPKLSREITPTSSCYVNMLKSASEKNISVSEAKPRQTYELDMGAELTILAPLGISTDLNENSVVCRLVYGKTSFLFTGDAGKESEELMLDEGFVLDSDVLKVGHHGSSGSSTKAFLDAVLPEIAVIMLGADNKYGHPHDETIERLLEYTDEIYRTDMLGDIIIVSDGSRLSFVEPEA